MNGLIGTLTQTIVGTTQTHVIDLAIMEATVNIGGSNVSGIDDVPGLPEALDDKQPLSDVLTDTTASFTTALESKLGDIEEGAQVNVPADWNTTQNKPATFPPSTHTHTVTKSDVGLGNVDNTSDVNKPISTATQTALNGKATSLWQKMIFHWTHSTSTNGNMNGSTFTGNGSFTPAVPAAAGNIWAGLARSLYSNLVTTANQVLGVRIGENIFHIGNVAGKGGFAYRARFGMEVWNNSGRMFAGICAGTSVVVVANPSANNNSCGFCVDSTDSGAISFLTRDGTSFTKTPTGLTLTSGAAYDIEITCAPNGTSISWSIREINTLSNVAVTGTAVATLPVNTVMMGPCVLASNAALTPATSVQIGVCTIFVQTDY